MRDFVTYREELRTYMRQFASEAPGPMGAFGKLHRDALEDGALLRKHKELMALAIGMVQRCDGCVAFHMNGALKAGATRDEVLEAIGVGLMMSGGPGSVYAAKAMKALEQFTAQRQREMALPHPS